MLSSTRLNASKFLLIIAFITLTFSYVGYYPVQGELLSSQLPSVKDPHLRVELVFKGVKFPTSMAFLGSNDILVLEKNEGMVKRIVNGTMLPNPVLDVNVSTESERGMLGIAVAKNATTNITHVFSYYTESAKGDGSDINEGIKPLGNRLYRYDLVNNKLTNPKILLDLPATPGPTHNGGKIVIGPDNNVYLVIGIVGTTANTKTQTQNVKYGLPPDGRGGILRITQDGQVVPGKGPLGDTIPLSIYYAYGIRNSFGIGFDPLTRMLWDTENGPNFGDEINLVVPGFNSGWNKVQGIWKDAKGYSGNITLDPKDLVDFGEKGTYQAPKFIWHNSSGPTALTFFNSNKLGMEYENDMFVGDFHNGYVYDFDLDEIRQKLILPGPLSDGIANNNSELQGIIFGEDLGGITDLMVGPDGYLYILSLYQFPGGTNCDLEYGDPSKPCIQYSSSTEGSIFRVIAK